MHWWHAVICIQVSDGFIYSMVKMMSGKNVEQKKMNIVMPLPLDVLGLGLG